MPKPRRAERASCLALRHGGALVAVLLGLGIVSWTAQLGGNDGTSITAHGDLLGGNVGQSRLIPYGPVVWPPPPGRAGAGDSEAVFGQLVASAPHVETEPASVPLQSGPAAIICAAYTTWRCSEALAVARCESGLDPDGNLFQIDYEAHKDKTESREALRDPAENVRVAHIIWLDSGWWAWRWSAGCHGLVPGSLPAAGVVMP